MNYRIEEDTIIYFNDNKFIQYIIILDFINNI